MDIYEMQNKNNNNRENESNYKLFFEKTDKIDKPLVRVMRKKDVNYRVSRERSDITRFCR